MAKNKRQIKRQQNEKQKTGRNERAAAARGTRTKRNFDMKVMDGRLVFSFAQGHKAEKKEKNSTKHGPAKGVEKGKTTAMPFTI